MLFRSALIGVMQVPTNPCPPKTACKPATALLNPAWNWITNAKTGASTFKGFLLGTAIHYSKKTIDSGNYPGLMPLAGTNQEGVALGLYKGFGNQVWYLVPQCSANHSQKSGPCTGGSWGWVENPNPCTNGGTKCITSIPSRPDKNVVIQVDLVTKASDPCPN